MNLKEEIKTGIACDSVGHPHSIVGRTVCLSVHPGKMLLFPFLKWFEKRYAGKYRFARTMFSIDLVLVGIMLALGSMALFMWLFPARVFEDGVVFEADVAPHEIVTGASSTLVIRWINQTNEELRDAYFTVDFPKHFLLQEFDTLGRPLDENRVEVGTVSVGGTGTVRVRGVMFGDVQGEQVFTGTLRFVHGEGRNLAGTKRSQHIFSPTRSTLAITLTLPEKLLSFQDVDGLIAYHNTGEIDFPEIAIEPEWPDGFETTRDIFRVPAIKAGQSGEVRFKGYLGDVGEMTRWLFHPSFVFGEDRYRQETLTHDAPVIPPPLELSHGTIKSALQPGATAVFTVEYKHVGEFPVSDVRLGIESDSPFLSNALYMSDPIKNIQPEDQGSAIIQVPLRSTISQSETSVFENLTLETRSIATYKLGDGSGQEVTSKGASIESLLTTPLSFDAFARYTTLSGDQIGRGSLPPRVDQSTSYWLFWNVGQTTNAIENIVIEAVLPKNVTFTGRQSTSQNAGVTYDDSTRTVRWTADRIDPTLSPISKIVGVAFEVELTPTDDQVDTVADLMTNLSITARDSVTGALLTRSASDLTTSLPNDPRASGKGEIKP
jgi:hypothetical protein